MHERVARTTGTAGVIVAAAGVLAQVVILVVFRVLSEDLRCSDSRLDLFDPLGWIAIIAAPIGLGLSVTSLLLRVPDRAVPLTGLALAVIGAVALFPVVLAGVECYEIVA